MERTVGTEGCLRMHGSPPWHRAAQLGAHLLSSQPAPSVVRRAPSIRFGVIFALLDGALSSCGQGLSNEPLYALVHPTERPQSPKTSQTLTWAPLVPPKEPQHGALGGDGDPLLTPS